MSDWKRYKKIAFGEGRPYVEGEDLAAQGITINPDDVPPVKGGMVLRNPEDYNDQWYISPKKFAQLYDPRPVESC